jgi:Ca2+-binding EF-hand superfamily protein
MNYRNTLIAAAAAVTAVSFAGTTLANENDKSGKAGATFDSLDTNRDGRISRAEASADSKIVFARADANGDGYLDTMEFSKASKMKDDSTSSPQSMPDSSEPVTPNTTEPVSPDSTTPPADTETPRQ